LKRLKESKKYAKALLDHVGIEKAPQALTELSMINDLMAKSKEFKSLLINPQFTPEEREKIIKQITGKLKLSDNVIKFVSHLTELMLIIHLSEIIKIATSLYLEKKKRAKAVVMTPLQISKNYEDKLRTSLKKLTNRDVDIEYVMDPSLLGGVQIKVGSTLYDTSIKGQLRLLKNELMKG
jgi:F-type H+-transporting ATPase subunit delta